uniref:L-2,4-diaminobutyric acid acetyltransferase n=1 Tax=Candidatus Kentrum sp. LFY TaxID=2126342 RepID=A0A450UT93_9GAMM|nr:MAG: diaminobutyrate acetyltransferase [Candidatus Kentron sp. LFY]VFJ95676.1 MAG: diaminobutyrate acetyltransferase [Candidatus Kentron sp. LFY]
MLPDTTITFRSPRITDGAAIWRLVREIEAFDLNSPYAYFVFGEHFAGTCVVAVRNDAIVGFVLAYIPPIFPDSLFVWQVGTAKTTRRQGLALQMILTILRRRSCRHIESLRTTVTPSNRPSRALFTAVARLVGGKLEEQSEYLRAEWFPEHNHEAESLFVISPIRLA